MWNMKYEIFTLNSTYIYVECVSYARYGGGMYACMYICSLCMLLGWVRQLYLEGCNMDEPPPPLEGEKGYYPPNIEWHIPHWY